MKIALASCPVVNRNMSHNIAVILQTMKDYAGKADLILFGESVLQGFDCLSWDYETDRSMAVTQNNPAIARIREGAREYSIAVSFGYIEKTEETLFSSQIVIDAKGEIIHNFHRVSVGWKEYTKTDDHYREGAGFEAFSYGGKKLAIGLCGDLWTGGRPEEMKRLHADAVLWPVWCDYEADQWNTAIKYEYAEQAALCGNCVLLVNPFCADPDAEDQATGGAVYFKNGSVQKELSAGKPGILIVEI